MSGSKRNKGVKGRHAVRRAHASTVAKEAPLLKLDLGCGLNKREGYTGVDKYGDVADIKHDLFTFPWPFADESVDEVWSSHFLEHVPAKLRPRLMDELYRILKWGAKATFLFPYWSSPRAYQDYTHEWPPLSENSFFYFWKKWRDDNKLTHGLYEMTCDFDFTWTYMLNARLQNRAPEFQQAALAEDINAVDDLQVTLTKTKRETPK